MSRDPRHRTPTRPRVPEAIATTEVVVVAGGHEPRPDVLGHIAADAIVVAADSGWDGARRLGLRPSLVVGDMDSISAHGLASARDAGIVIEEHPADKDATDTELALRRAARMGATRITLVAGGDRIDHVLGALGCLTDPVWDDMEVRGFVGTARLTRVGPRCDLRLATAIGATISLVAVAGAAEGVRTDGLRWPLAGERLEPWQSRGLSNVATDDTVAVAVDAGTLLVIEPHFFGTDSGDHRRDATTERRR